MNWEAIGAVGDIIGAGAVVVSLLYLAIQVRTQNIESRVASTHEIFDAFRNIVKPFQEPEVAALFIKATNDGFENLTEQERFQLVLSIVPFLRVWEEAFYQRQSNRLDDAIWSSITSQYTDAMGSPVNQKVWHIRRHVFSEEFRDYVDSIEPGEYKLE